MEKDFPEGKPFSLVQVGAHDGISHDDLYNFAIHRQLSGLLIEPQPELFKALENNYSKQPAIFCVNCAVHPGLSEVHLYRVNPAYLNQKPQWANGIGSLQAEHITNAGIAPEHIEIIKVRAAPLMELIRQANIQHIDLLQIDTEGFDLEVLKMFDFTSIKPRYIRIEIQGLSGPDQQSVQAILQQQRYQGHRYGMDWIARLKQ